LNNERGRAIFLQNPKPVTPEIPETTTTQLAMIAKPDIMSTTAIIEVMVVAMWDTAQTTVITVGELTVIPTTVEEDGAIVIMVGILED
jgi:hypothetical protein